MNSMSILFDPTLRQVLDLHDGQKVVIFLTKESDEDWSKLPESMWPISLTAMNSVMAEELVRQTVSSLVFGDYGLKNWSLNSIRTLEAYKILQGWSWRPINADGDLALLPIDYDISLPTEWVKIVEGRFFPRWIV